MTRWRAIALGLVILALVATGGVGTYWLAGSNQTYRPDFTLADLNGRPRSISEFDGNVLVINFWATWCAPCRREIPMLAQVQRDYADRGLQIVGVAVDTRGAATAFADRYPIDYPILADATQGARVQDDYTGSDARAGVLPYTVIVDRSGDIVTRIAGALTRQRLTRLVDPLLEKTAAVGADSD